MSYSGSSIKFLLLLGGVTLLTVGLLGTDTLQNVSILDSGKESLSSFRDETVRDTLKKANTLKEARRWLTSTSWEMDLDGEYGPGKINRSGEIWTFTEHGELRRKYEDGTVSNQNYTVSERCQGQPTQNLAMIKVTKRNGGSTINCYDITVLGEAISPEDSTLELVDYRSGQDLFFVPAK